MSKSSSRRQSRLVPRLERLEAREAPVIKFLSSFEGMNQAAGGNFEPPDTTLAVGPNRIIEEENSAIALYDKSGKQLDTSLSNPFFGKVSSAFVYDPVCVYDEYAQRFVISFLQLDNANSKSYLLLAVSNTSSPNSLTSADWKEIDTVELTEDQGGTLYWGDYPKLGYNREAYVFTFNMFGFSGGTTHARVLAIDKSSVLDQNPATVTSFVSNPGNNQFTMCAAAMHDAPVNSPMWFVSENGPDIDVVQMTNILSNSPSYTVTAVPVNGWAPPPSATQPDGSQVSSVGPRMLNAAWRDGRLVSAHAVDGGDGQPKVAWYEFNTAGGTPTKTQEGRINPGSGIATYIPGVEITPAGGIGLTYMETDNKSEFISMYMTGQQAGKPPGFMDPAIKIFAGKANYVGGRQGDYSGIQIDPVTGTFWAGNEFTDAGGSWTTGVGQIQLGTPPVITSLSVDPNPINQGETATLTATFTDADSPNDSFNVVINWGDGSPPTTLQVPVGRRSFSAQHLFLTAGAAVVTVAITDQDGNTGTGSVTVNAFGTPPTARITGAPTGQVDEGKKIVLGSFVTHPNPGETFSYAWRVLKNGVDYTQGGNAGLSFIPDDNGVYDVFLAVTASGGATGNAPPVQIIVRNVAPTATQLTNDGPKAVGQTVHLALQNPTDAQADLDAGLQYQFDTNGDGIYDTAWGPNPFVDVTFPAQGIFTVKAHIRDKDGGISPDYTSDVWISNTGGGNGGVITTRFVVAGSETSINNGLTTPASVINVYNTDGTPRFTNLHPLGGAFTAGYRVAVGDVNGDHVEDIIAGPGPGGGSTISVLDGTTGNVMFTLPNVYGPNWKSGVYVAAGDFNRDGFADIVVAPGAGQVGPVMGFSGFDQHLLFKISPFGASTAGATVAVGDVDGDKRPDLIVGNATVGSQVKVFRYTSAGLSAAAYRTFVAMPTVYSHGVFVAAGDLDGDGKAEVIVGSNFSPGYDSRVRTYSGATNALLRDFVAFPAYRLGVRVAADDIDGDGKADIILSPAGTAPNGGTPQLIGLHGLDLRGQITVSLTQGAFRGGVYVG
jgi:hypothetical protein